MNLRDFLDNAANNFVPDKQEILQKILKRGSFAHKKGIVKAVLISLSATIVLGLAAFAFTFLYLRPDTTVNILGAPIGTLCSFAFIFITNLISLIRYTKVMPNLFATLIKPLISGLACGAAAYLVFNLSAGGGLFTIAAIAAAGVTYLVMLFALRTFTADDILAMPKGEKLLRVFKKLRLVR